MKNSSSIKYRLRQKLKYHFSKDDFEKRVAEINRNKEQIEIQKNTFKIKGYPFQFDKINHGFILENYEALLVILDQKNIDFQIQKKELTCHVDGLVFNVTTAEEIFIIKEIWVEGTYNLEFNISKKYIVMDIGMNVGLASLFFCTKDFIKKIYSYEPFKPTFEIADLNISQNPHVKSKIHTYNFGLSSKDEELDVNYSSSNRGRTGIWGTELVLGDVKSEIKEKITLKSFNNELSRIIQENPENDVILKIDCEGSEYDIFKDLDMDLLKPVNCILLEWHKRGPDLIIDKLKKSKFSTISFNSNSQKVGMLYAFK